MTGTDNNVGSEQPSSSDATTNSQTNSDSNSNSNSNSNKNLQAAPSSPNSNPQPTPIQKEPPSVVTKASTIVVTAAGQTSAQQTVITTTETASPSSGPNKAGIAAGVVVGMVALSAIAGGIFFFLRNRKKRAMEEEYRHNLANSYGPKPPPSSAGSASDSRLEPSVMMQRRQSDGSIADNQDYSRRILKVSFLAYWFRRNANLSQDNKPRRYITKEEAKFDRGIDFLYPLAVSPATRSSRAFFFPCQLCLQCILPWPAVAFRMMCDEATKSVALNVSNRAVIADFEILVTFDLSNTTFFHYRFESPCRLHGSVRFFSMYMRLIKAFLSS